MPKHSKKTSLRAVHFFEVKDTWKRLYDENVSRYPAPAHQAILRCLHDFLSSSQATQLVALRRLVSTVGKARDDLSLLVETSSLFKSCLLPIALEVHFASTGPSENSFRSAAFSLVARIHEFYENAPEDSLWDRTIVRDRLSNDYQGFLQNIADGPLDDSVISHFGAVIMTTLDRSIGKDVVGQSFGATLSLLVRCLTVIVNEVSDSSASTNATTTIIYISNRLSRCTDLLKIAAALLTRYPGIVQVMIEDSGPKRDVVQDLLNATLRICFSHGFLQENQFMAGFLAPALLDITQEPSTIVGALFGYRKNAPGDILQVNIPSMSEQWVGDAHWDFSALCIYRGLLINFAGEKCLTKVAFAGEHPTLIGLLYKQIIDICDRATESGIRVLAFQTLATWLSNVEQILKSRKTLPLTLIQSTVELVRAPVIEKLFGYVFDQWEDPIDTVQHKLKDLFVGLLDVLHVQYVDIDTDLHVQMMINGLLKADWHRKVKYDLLSLMLSKVRPQALLRLRADFLEHCFAVMTNIMLASRISAFINRFIKEALSDIGVEDESSAQANEFWVNPVCIALTSESLVIRKICSENMIHIILKEKHCSFQLLMNALQHGVYSKDATGSAFRLHGTIAVVKAARMLGLLELSSFLAENRDMVEQAISHPDANLRVDVLALLCETRQGTADFSEEELFALKKYLLISLDSQSPEFRQRVQAYLVKLLRRIRRAMYSNWRDYLSRKMYIDEHAKASSKPSNLDQMTEIANDLNRRLIMKRDFLAWLGDSTVASLFPGCSFQRTTCNLYLMTTILESEDSTIDVNTKVNLAEVPDYPTLANRETVQVLLAIIFNDTYAPNREKAFELLMQFPAPLAGIVSVRSIQTLLAKGIAWISSIRSHESDTGATVVRLVFAKYVKGMQMYLDVDTKLKLARGGCPMAYFVKQLMELLARNIDIAAKNLYLSASGHPMHGLFRALQNVLLEIDFGAAAIQANIEEWQRLVRDIMNLIKSGCDAVLSVCADESPEGNLPASFADMQQNMEDLIVEAGAASSGPYSDRGSQAQLILYSCFHTIKETTAVIQALICRTPLPLSQSDSESLVTFEQIVESGDQLRTLLASIRHRGAFSAVHVCFASVCATLLSSGKEFLVELPKAWLDGFLAQVVSVDVSITRRSAGLPLGVLAIVSAPVPSRKLLLTSALNKLFAIGMQDVPAHANERLDLPQVHAYNVIRAILQDAEVASEVRDHIGEAFALSIKGFSSRSFPIRNCAAMLFSTLITKALGTKKSRDEMNIVNTVTGREFFVRFPKLHSLLLQQLTEAVEKLEEGEVHPALYPILTILARLKPSVLEGSDTLMTLSAFGTVVARCAMAAIFKVREMSARAYAPLILSSNLIPSVERLIQQGKSASQNHLHGALLQIQYLLRVHLASDVAGKDIRRDATIRLPTVFLAASDIALNNSCPVTKALYLSIVTEFFIQAAWVRDEVDEENELDALATQHFVNIRQTFRDYALEALRRDGEAAFMGYSVRRAQALLVLRCLAVCPPNADQGTRIILDLLDDREYEVQLATIGFIKDHIHTNTCVNITSAQIKQKLRSLVLSASVYYQVVQEAAKLLVQMELSDPSDGPIELENFANSILQVLSSSPKPHLAESILPLLGMEVHKVHVAPEALQDPQTLSTSYVKIIQFWCRDEQPLAVRASVVTSLQNVIPVIDRLEESNVVDILFLLDQLLQDDDPDIRECTARIVSSMLKFKQPVTASRCRTLLGFHIATHPWAGGFELVVERFQKVLLNHDIKTILAGESQSTDVLFAQEEHNSRREEFVDMVLASACLKRLFANQTISASCGKLMIKFTCNWVRTAMMDIKRAAAASFDATEFFSRPRVFGCVASVINAAFFLSHVGSMDGEIVIGQIREMEYLHPNLKAMAAGGQKGKLIKSICLGEANM
ncbi:uncharacterized protein SPPG_04346, partial [Spizellomyces punctatus DAOM BR117]